MVKIIEGNDLPAKERVGAGRFLGVLGDPRAHVMSVDQMQFCLVPEGVFWMGSNDQYDTNAYSDEKPLHEVDLKQYCISRYPITNAQFMEFVNDGGYDNPSFWKEAEESEYWKDGMFKGWRDKEPRRQPFNFGHPFTFSNHPVVGVTWYEALAFTRWLTEKWKKQQLIDTNHFVLRLPTEAEWEKAARGGKDILRSPVIGNIVDQPWLKQSAIQLIQNSNPIRIYSWGESQDIDKPDFEKMNAEETGIGTTNVVGCFSGGVSPYGVLEMIGNVWEWTLSLHKKYHYIYSDEREGEKNNKSRVLRGGAYWNDKSSVRCARRYRFGPVLRVLGSFRVAMAPFLL